MRHIAFSLLCGIALVGHAAMAADEAEYWLGPQPSGTVLRSHIGESSGGVAFCSKPCGEVTSTSTRNTPER